MFGLPVPRSRVFLAKLLAPGLALSGYVLASELLRWAQHLQNPTSFGGESFRADWQGWALVLSLLLVWVCVGYCQLLAVFRRFGLMLVVTVYFVAAALEGRWPWLRNLPPASILRVEFAGQRPLVQWNTVGAHVLAALVACTLAACIWVGPMERLESILLRWARRPLLAWSAGSCCALVTILAIGRKDASERQGQGSTPSIGEAAASSGLDSAPVTRRTRHYELHYPEALAARIDPLAVVADDIYERLAERLGMGARGQPVVVDLTRRSPTHAGSATVNTIRMDPFARPTADALERTFAHETAHVLAFLASDRRLISQEGATAFFNEGLALALALELRPSADEADALHLEAALARQRLRPTFADLIRYGEFTLRHGPFLAYPLGFTWTRALLDSCGPEAPGRLLRALGSPDVPLALAPEALWQHLLQRAQCDIVRVNAAWESQLEAITAKMKPEIERVPELLGGTPRWAGDEVLVRAQLDGAPLSGSEFSILVRTKTTGPERSGVAFVSTPGPGGELEFHVPSSIVVDGALQFQLSQRFERQGIPVRIAHEWTKSLVAR